MRGAIPADWLEPLRVAFEAGYLPSEAWPAPRASDWRHAEVDLDPVVRDTCRVPALIEAAGALLGAPFFLSQVEGREPRPGAKAQPLHRDGEPGATLYAGAIVFLDDYAASNGATRLVPRSHRDPTLGEAQAVTLEGCAGDVLVFDPNLLHGGGENRSGAARRSLLLTWALFELRESLAATAALRGVRMDLGETFAALAFPAPAP